MTTIALRVRGHMSLGNEPKTARSKRTVAVARSVLRQLKTHLLTCVGAVLKQAAVSPQRLPGQI